jgi:hypothetical protein
MTWTNITKPNNTFSNKSKPNTTWSDGIAYLLTQSLGFLLLESGGKIILDQSFNNKPSNTWVNISK